MNANRSLFLITSRHSFLADAERIAAGPAAARILGSGSLSDGIAASRSGATAILLDLDSGAEDGIKTVRKLCDQARESCVIVASSNRDPDLILQAMRAGAADFLTMPLDRRALDDSLERVTRRAVAETVGVNRQAKVISFLSAKGGCGSTTLAANLAVSMCADGAASDRSVVLLDLDSPGGDVSAMLNLRPAYNLSDVASNIHRLDMDLLRSMAVQHESGLYCIAAAGEGDNPGWLNADQMGTVVEFLSRHFDVVMLAGGAPGPVEMAAIGQAHAVHLVTTLDFLALKRAQGLLGRLRGLGVPAETIRVVVNRLTRGGQINLQDVRESLDSPVVWTVADDVKAAQRAASEGVPLSLRAGNRMKTSIRDYASTLAGNSNGSSGRNGLGALFRKFVPGRSGAPDRSAAPDRPVAPTEAGR